MIWSFILLWLLGMFPALLVALCMEQLPWWRIPVVVAVWPAMLVLAAYQQYLLSSRGCPHPWHHELVVQRIGCPTCGTRSVR